MEEHCGFGGCDQESVVRVRVVGLVCSVAEAQFYRRVRKSSRERRGACS